MRSLSVSLHNLPRRAVMRVVSSDSLANAWHQDLSFLVPVATSEELVQIQTLIERGLSNVTPLIPAALLELVGQGRSGVVAGAEVVIVEDDVVVLNPLSNRLHVLNRGSDRHQAVFLTNRCNSNCLMCSQPPTRHDDSWLIVEALEQIRH